MSNYLKKSLFCLLILLMPYMNIASNSMSPEDNEASTVRSRKVSPTESTVEEKMDDSSSASFSVKPLNINLEDSQSWVSYVLSPVKTTFQVASEVINIVRHNQHGVVIGGLFIVSQVMAVAANCNCVCQQQSNHNNKQYVGSYLERGACQGACFKLPGYWELSECTK